MEIDKEHAKQWMWDHLWEYFPEKRIAYTQESKDILNKMFQDYTDRYYPTYYFSDPVYDKDTRTLSVSVSVGFKGE